MNPTKFSIARFRNRNGAISWRVEGRLHGERIRRNFKTREDAAAEKAALELRALRFAAGQRAIVTALTEKQAREAEAVFSRLSGKPQELSFYVDFALANYREPQKQKSLKDAIHEYVEAKNREFNEDHISVPHIKRIRYDLSLREKHFPNRTVAELTAPGLIAYFEMGRPALKTYNNRRGIVFTFLKFAFHRGWIGENPFDRIPSHRIRRKRGLAATLAADAALGFMGKMERFEGGRWIPYFALCLFAGIQPSVPNGEITRLKPEDISLERKRRSRAAEPGMQFRGSEFFPFGNLQRVPRRTPSKPRMTRGSWRISSTATTVVTSDSMTK